MTYSLKRSDVGHLLHNSSGHLVNQCPPSEPTCDIDCSTLASLYTITGVNDLAGCSACLDSSEAAWDGVVQQISQSCTWVLSAAASVAGKTPSYSGVIKADCTSSDPNGVGIWYNRDECRWELAITCRNATQYHVIWAGTKNVERGPTGVYTRVCGCDETPTLRVV